MRIALISDTHLPRGARIVPHECVEAMETADLIVHTGDLNALSVLEWLSSLGPPVRAVHGNVDSAEVVARLPETDMVDVDGLTLALIHDAGPAKGRLERMQRRFPEADAAVIGHSHQPLHERGDGFQIFNPGSPTERRRAPRHSFGIAETAGGTLEFRHVILD